MFSSVDLSESDKNWSLIVIVSTVWKDQIECNWVCKSNANNRSDAMQLSDQMNAITHLSKPATRVSSFPWGQMAKSGINFETDWYFADIWYKPANCNVWSEPCKTLSAHNLLFLIIISSIRDNTLWFKWRTNSYGFAVLTLYGARHLIIKSYVAQEDMTILIT